MASRPPQPRSESTSSLARSSLLRALDPSSRRSPVASTSQLPSPMEEGTTGAGRKSPKVGFRGHASGARRAEGGGAYDPGASAPLLMGGGSGGGSGGMSPDLGRKGSRSPTFPLRRRTSNTPSTHSASASTPNPNSNGNRRRSTSLASLKGFFRPGSPESDRTVTAGGGKRKSFGIGGGSGSSTTTIAEGAASASSPPLSSSLSRSRSVTKRDSLPGPGGKKKRNSLVFGILGSPRLGSYDESEEGRGRGGGLGFVDVDEENEIRWEMEEKMRVRERLDELVSRVLFQSGTDANNNPIILLCPSRLPAPSALPPPLPLNLSQNTPSTSQDPYAAFYDRLLARFVTLTSSSPFVLVILSSPLPGSSPSAGPRAPSEATNGTSIAPPAATLPSLKTLLTLFFSLPPPPRKNVSKILIVHPTFWTRFLMKLILGVGVVGGLGVGMVVVSAKGRRKVRGVRDLSGLAVEVPIQQLNIPPEVYVHDLTLSSSISLSGASLPSPSSSSPYPPKLFGVPLESLMPPSTAPSSLQLPSIVRDSLDLIRKSGLETPGIFRKPPLSSTLRILAAAYDRHQVLDLEDYGPHQAPFLAAGLLRMFLGRLPRGLFGKRTVEVTKRCGCRLPSGAAMPDEGVKGVGDEGGGGEEDAEAVRWAREKFIPAFHHDVSASSPSQPHHHPPIAPSHLLLSSVLSLLHDLSLRKDKNRMDARNLAICMAPVLVRTGEVEVDAGMCRLPVVEGGVGAGEGRGGWTITAVLQLLIERYFEIFDEGDLVELESSVPLRPDLFTNSSPPRHPPPSSGNTSPSSGADRSLSSARGRGDATSPTRKNRRHRSPSTPRSETSVLAHATFVSPSQEGAPSGTTTALHALTSITANAKDGSSPNSEAEAGAGDGAASPPRPGGPRMRKESTTTIGSQANTLKSRRSVGSGISAYGSISRGSMRLSKAVSASQSRRSSVAKGEDEDGAGGGGEVKGVGSGVEASAVSAMGLFSRMESEERVESSSAS